MPLAFGLGTADQAVPFHDSTRVALAALVPTAVQLVALTHETLMKPAYEAPTGLGLGTIDQAVPFQDSARRSLEPEFPMNV